MANIRLNGVQNRQISRRAWLQIAAASAMGSRTSVSGSADRPPNIVFIMADDLGYGTLGCYGGKPTPHIEALAERGMRFTDYHSNGAVCSPTRAALMTGRYQQRCGVDGVILADDERHLGMPLDEITIAEVMRDAGYATGIAGKWHLGYETKFGPNAQGFDFFRGFVSGNVDYVNKLDRMGIRDWWLNEELVDEEGYLTDLIAAHAASFIDTHADQPFFLYVPHGAPHSPFQGRDDSAIRIEGEVVKGNGDPAHYDQMIAALDDSAGTIVDALRRNNIEEDTLVIFCSDNGPTPQGSSGGLRGLKGSVWEGGHRVPCIAAWPGRIQAQSVCEETVMSMDFFPTFAAMAGASIPSGLDLDGVDISGALLHGESLAPRPLYWKFGDKIAMRDGPWKYVLNGNDEGLYRIDTDRAESRDLSGAHPDRFSTMQRRVREWYADIERGVPFVT